MNSLCITGLIQEDLDFITHVLGQAGMQAAKPATRDANVSMTYWHDQVMKLPMVRYTEVGDDEQYTDKQHNIGRLWEQLASDIFISNLDSEVWGWADSRSTEVLPFWKQFDPQTRFLLIAVSPERYIAHHIESSQESLDHQVLLSRWMTFHQALLRFHRDNPTISMLVDFEDCASQLGALIRASNHHFKLGLSPVHFPNVTPQEISDIARFLAIELCALHPAHENFARDLQASLTPVGYSHGASRVATPIELIARYRALKSLNVTQAEAIAKQGDNQSIKDLKADLESLVVEHSATVEALTKERNAEFEITKALQEELEADKKQTARLQEELESYHLKHQEVVKQLEQAKKESVARKTELDQSVVKQKETAELLTKERSAQSERVKALQEELEADKKQTAILQKELESIKLQHHQLIDREKYTQEENDLLLAQLHQVQEELESYFLRYKETDEKLQSLESRFNRMLARHPNDIMVDAVEVVSTEVGSVGLTQWRVQGLELGAKRYDELQFSSFIEAGVACLTLSRQGGDSGCFVRWPGNQEDQTVEISTVGNEATGPKRASALMGLSATDWQLVRAIVALLVKELTQTKILNLPKDFNTEAQANAFVELQQELDQLPSLLHFDSLSLGMYQEEPEYEFLTFSFENCFIGQRLVPEFAFRLASVNIPTGQFGTNPRLEFHELRSKPAFEGWFEESHDDYGAKLELRFAQPNAMDLGVWQKMTQTDQAFVGALIAQLPIFLKHMQSDTRDIQRNWDDWIELADQMHTCFLNATESLKFSASFTENGQAASLSTPAGSYKASNQKRGVKRKLPVKQVT